MLKENDYIEKLKTSLDFILNDVPDNRDDTINSKLIDSIKMEFNTKLIRFTCSYLEDNLIKSDLEILVSKESDVKAFFFDLFRISHEYLCKNELVDEFNYDKFLLGTLKYVRSYLIYANFGPNQSEIDIESNVLCSILALISDLDKLKSKERSFNCKLILNQEIYDECLFNRKSIMNYLTGDCKSMYVCKAFKNLLIGYILELIHAGDETRIIDLCDLINENQDLKIVIFNMDVYSEIYRAYFRQFKTVDNSHLKSIHDKLKFNEKKTQILLNYDLLNSDVSIEAFTCLVAFDLVINKDEEIHTKFIRVINRICNHFVSVQLLNKNMRSFNCLFKFQIYMYEFVQEYTGLENVKEAIEHLITLPIHANFSRTESNKISGEDLIDENYLLLINDRSFEYKELLLKQCLVNLGLFGRKFTNVNLLGRVSCERVCYLLRNLNLNVSIKNLILQFINEYLLLKQDQEYSNDLITVLTEDFSCKLNSSFNVNLFNLVSTCLIICDKYEKFKVKLMRVWHQLNTAIHSNLLKIENDSDFKQQFMILMHFLHKLLNSQSENCKLFAIDHILNENEYGLVGKSIDYLCEGLNLIDRDSINELSDSIYLTFQLTFRYLAGLLQENPCQNGPEPSFYLLQVNKVFTRDLMEKVERACLCESEAFIRREALNFLYLYNLYEFKHWLFYLKDNLSNIKFDQVIDFNKRFFNICNYFSYFLLHDHDWQCQLYAINYFQDVSKLLCSLLDRCDFLYKDLSYLNDDKDDNLQIINGEIMIGFSKLSIFEIFYCASDCMRSILHAISDYDQHVVHESSKILFNLKNDNNFMYVLTALNVKPSSFLKMSQNWLMSTR